MLGLCQDTQFPEFLIQIFHKSGNSRFDHTEVMIIQFLSLRRHCTKQGSSGIYQVRSLIKQFLVDQEVFLFRPNTGTYIFYILAKEL